MFQPKLGLYALTLESTAWVGLLLGSTSDAALLAYLAVHAAASFMLGLATIVFLPAGAGEVIRVCRGGDQQRVTRERVDHLDQAVRAVASNFLTLFRAR